jgi:hypothetical protein
MIEPKVVGVLSNGQKVYWCRKLDRQILDVVCLEKYFTRYPKSECRRCLGLAKRQRLPEPWASVGKEDEQINVVEVS